MCVGLESGKNLRAVGLDVALVVDDRAVVGVNPMHELVHRVVEGLGWQTIARNARLFLDRLVKAISSAQVCGGFSGSDQPVNGALFQ